MIRATVRSPDKEQSCGHTAPALTARCALLQPRLPALCGFDAHAPKMHTQACSFVVCNGVMHGSECGGTPCLSTRQPACGADVVLQTNHNAMSCCRYTHAGRCGYRTAPTQLHPALRTSLATLAAYSNRNHFKGRAATHIPLQGPTAMPQGHTITLSCYVLSTFHPQSWCAEHRRNPRTFPDARPMKSANRAEHTGRKGLRQLPT